MSDKNKAKRKNHNLYRNSFENVELNDFLYRSIVKKQTLASFTDLMQLQKKPVLHWTDMFPVGNSISLNSENRIKISMPYWPVPFEQYWYERPWRDPVEEGLICIRVSSTLLAASRVKFLCKTDGWAEIETWRDQMLVSKDFSHVGIFGTSEVGLSEDFLGLEKIVEIINMDGFKYVHMGFECRMI